MGLTYEARQQLPDAVVEAVRRAAVAKRGQRFGVSNEPLTPEEEAMRQRCIERQAAIDAEEAKKKPKRKPKPKPKRKQRRTRKPKPEPERVFPGITILDEDGNECLGMRDRTGDKGKARVDREAIRDIRAKNPMMKRRDFINAMQLACEADESDYLDLLAAWDAVESERIWRLRREAKERKRAAKKKKKERRKRSQNRRDATRDW